MKINVSSVVRDHLRTLRNVESSRVDYVDLIIFYGTPIAVAVAAFYSGFCVTIDGYSVSITFFGIFLALLLNIQVAIFGIFQRKWDAPSDPRLAEMQRQNLADRRTLLKELNSNISYLTLISCTGLSAVLMFYVFKITNGFGPAFSAFVYVHFILTFIMIIKRSHALFQKEYRDSPD